MGKEDIVERIISDAEEEARKIVAAAEEKAAQTVAEAEKEAERTRIGTKAEVAEKVKGILDGKAATARLDCAKIMLGAKREVIDQAYAQALELLIGLNKDDSLSLAEDLLVSYAEDGDKIMFAENYRFAEEVAKLQVVKDKKLKVSPVRADLDGGFILVGKDSDKNLSYGALLSADREEKQAEIAAQIFITG
ncbi:MAG: V-type ATP synthase subunit E [Candidatus Coproplasma sp.]